MAQKIIIQTEIQSNTAQEIKQAKELKNTYDSAASSAAKIGGTAGSRMAAAKARPTGMTEAEYNASRGAAGLTGAGARDFASQAQGLGGLVRLYATYAANVFAVSAAFKALSDAMDTANIVQGLNQLGAASGVSLGSLAKQLANASDGAISLREAMEATAKATSSGISSTQLLQLGDVAKKASQALGVNMSDAVSRLTRGITKLEPELLDELGIFTKVGKATEDYALKVGKSVNSLTDFERRQAFANAVLAEGASKFGQINIPTNPYDKLLATLKNVSQTVLELVNKGITPLVSLLSTSPNALLALLTGIGALIVKQAIPALGQYRLELRKSADAALELAQSRSVAAKAAIDARNKEILAAKDLKSEIATQRIDVAEDALKKAQSGRIRKDIRTILDKTPLDVTDKDLAKLDKLGSSLKNNQNVYVQLARSIRDAKQANLDYIMTAERLEKAAAKGPSLFSAAGIAAARAESARRGAASRSIVSDVGETASVVGIGAAFKKLFSDISAEKLGTVRSAFTGIAGAVTILGTAIGGILTVASKLLGWIGVIIGIYQVLEMTLSKNSAQVGVFNDSLTVLSDTTKSATETAKKYEQTISVDSLLAKTNALLELSGAIEKTSRAFVDAKTSAGMWDNFTNKVLSLFGKGLEDKFSEQVADAISAGLGSIASPEIKAKAEAELMSLVNASSIQDISGRVKDMSSAELESLARKLPGIFNDISKASDKSVAPLKSVKDGFLALDKSFQELSNSLINKDPLSEFATKLARQSSTLATALQDPINATAVLNDILKDTSSIKMFPPETQKSILDAAAQMQTFTLQATKAKEQIDIANAKLKAAEQLDASELPKEIVVRFKLEAQAALAAATETYKISTTKVAQLTANLSTGLSKTVQESFKLIEAPLSRAIAQASIDTQKALLNLLPKTPESVKLQTNLEVQSIELKKQEISTTRNLIAAIDLDRISREKIALQDKIAKAGPQASPQEAAAMRAELTGLEQQEKAYKDPRSLRNSGEIISVGAQSIIQRNIGFLTQLQQLSQQQQSAKILGAAGEVTAGFDLQRKNLQEQQKAQEASLNFLKSTEAFKSMDLATQQQALAGYDQEISKIKEELDLIDYRRDLAVAITVQKQAEAVGAKEVVNLAKTEVAASKQRLDLAQSTTTTATAAAKAEKTRADQLALQSHQIALANIKLEEQNQLRDTQESSEEKLLDIRKQELDWQVKNDQISVEYYDKQIKDINKASLARQKANELYDLEAKYLVQVTGLLKEYSAATSATAREEAAAKIQSASTVYNAQVSGVERVYSAQESLLTLQNSLTSRQQAYSDIFKETFNSMADAMLEWVKTGKLNSRELFNSLIADIARYELRLQMMQIYSAAKPGLMSIVGSLFGGFNTSAASSTYSLTSASNYSGGGLGLKLNAMGDVYDAGLQKFAKGGAFTNSIVDTPTLFKFAQGAGLMGEAGPGAIMPLTRDSSGNLGVRSSTEGTSQPKVDVVINNYGTQQATAKETQDGKGNRRIEVVIGEAAAVEMARPGSQSQNAMKSTYGLTPQLIRR